MTEPAPSQAATDAQPASGVPARDAALRLVVVDADDRTRESVVGLLGIRERFRVVGSAGHLGAAIGLVEQQRPDVVIVDPRLPEVSGGVALIRAIRGIDPGIRILAVGWSPELEHDTLEAGADGFVRKTFRPAELADAISRCMASGADRPATGIIL
ncbi:MAG: response regulator transcription factor [Chloroflexota bacterium]